MAYENILFYKPNMAVRNSFFYLFDYSQKILTQKRADGGVSFQYPVNLPVSFTQYSVGDVICLQFDGFSFWTLQVFSDNSGVLLRRWVITNFICELVDQFPKINSTTFKYLASTFSLESYSTKLASNYLQGSEYITVVEYTDSVIYEGTLLNLYNERYDTKETLKVSYISGSNIYLETPLTYSFYEEDLVVITPSMYLFNNYYLNDNTMGSLIIIDPSTGVNLYVKPDLEYFGITSSKFCRLQNVLRDYSDVHTLTYIKGTNLKLKNIDNYWRYKANIRCSDDFNSQISTLPDETTWKIVSGDPYLIDNKLFCSSLGSGHDKLESLYDIVGDFSLEIDCTFSGIYTYSGTNIENKAYQYVGFNFNDSLEYSFGFNYSNVSQGVGISNMLMHHAFDGSVLDSMGMYNGTMYNNPTTSQGCDGTLNGAYTFDGTSYIKIESASSLELGKNNEDFSLVFWLKLNTEYNGSWQSITHKGLSESERTFAIWRYTTSNNLHIRLSTTGDSNLGADTVTPLIVGNWYMVSYVKNGSYFYTYINDHLETSTVIPGTVVSNQGPIYIGKTPWYAGAPCSIDNYTIFNRALDLSFIKSLYSTFSKLSIYNEEATPQFNAYINNVKYVTSSLSGICFPFNYSLKAEKLSNTLSIYYNILASGIYQGWNLLTNNIVPVEDCKLSLGLDALMVTASGCYFDDLIFDYGYAVFPNSGLEYYGIMNIDNVKKNQSTIIPIYAIDIEGDNLYRLQKDATYFGTDYTWTTYNFQISPLRSFIDFITIDADSHILPATGRNTTVVRSLVFDQYGNGVVYKPVSFVEDDPVGFMTSSTVYTDFFYGTGTAITGYTSGTALRVVNIVGSVTQVD